MPLLYDNMGIAIAQIALMFFFSGREKYIYALTDEPLFETEI